jgi:hypothetical protein
VNHLLELNTNEKIDYFYDLFSDLDYEIEELGYQGLEDELINTMLLNHYGIEFTDDFQLGLLTDCILNKKLFKAGITTYKLKKGLL